MITAKTITDAQIRELRKDRALESVCFCALYYAGDVGHAARTRCAEIFNERHATAGRSTIEVL